MREILNYEAEKKEHDRIAREGKWRMSVQVGDILDVQARYETPMSTFYRYIVGWARAKITDIIDEEHFAVGFIGRGANSSLKLSR